MSDTDRSSIEDADTTKHHQSSHTSADKWALKAWLQHHIGSRARRNLIILAVLTFIVTGLVSGVIEEYGVRAFHYVVSPERYIAVVVSERSVDFDIPKEFKAGFESGMNRLTSIAIPGGGSVGIVYREDGGDVEQATRIARELLADPNCTLVVGNSNSTLTAATLEVFLSDPDPPAYVLPIATSSDLLVRARDGRHGAVLRMVPDNDDQADRAARLIAHLDPNKRIAIVVDEENSVYSINLSRAIASTIRKSGGQILMEQGIGPSHTVFDALQKWSTRGEPNAEARPGVIVYVGVAHHGMLLVDQMENLAVKIPIIFTDGCMVQNLIQHASRRVEGYILSPVQKSKEKDTLVTYEPIGSDSAKLVNRLISECPDCGRGELREHIETQRSAGKLEFRGDAGSYKFSALGQNEDMSYRSYKILPDGQLEELSNL